MVHKPDTISCSIEVSKELQARFVDLSLTCQGSSLFTGNEAFEKAQELRELFEGLRAYGLTPEQLSIKNITLASGEGFFSLRSSSCTYSVLVSRVSVDVLPRVLATLAKAKNIEMQNLAWCFEYQEKELPELRAIGLRKLLDHAQQTAAALGVRLKGIYELRESLQTPNGTQTIRRRDDSKAAMRIKRPSDSLDFGQTLSFTGLLALSFEADFRISPFVTT